MNIYLAYEIYRQILKDDGIEYKYYIQENMPYHNSTVMCLLEIIIPPKKMISYKHYNLIYNDAISSQKNCAWGKIFYYCENSRCSMLYKWKRGYYFPKSSYTNNNLTLKEEWSKSTYAKIVN